MSALSPDLILWGGKIATMDGEDRFVSALAAQAGRIVALGDDEAITSLAGDRTDVRALDGRTAIPGIIDSHCHPDMHAARLGSWETVSPDRVATRGALLDHIATAAEARGPDDWIACYRFDDVKSGGYPTLDEMDRAAGGRPLFIQRTDGHLGLANRRAFAEVGLGTDPADPPFGSFDRHPETGELTGLARETAAHIFLSHIHSGDTAEMLADGLEQVFGEWTTFGITSVYNSLCGGMSIDAYQRMRAAGRLKMRVGIIGSGREDGLVESLHPGRHPLGLRRRHDPRDRRRVVSRLFDLGPHRRLLRTLCRHPDRGRAGAEHRRAALRGRDLTRRAFAAHKAGLRS